MLQSKLKSLNHRLLPQKVFHAPEWVVLGVNNICNLHCKMCDVGLKIYDTNFATNLTGTHPINMPNELIHKIIDESYQFSPDIKLGYAFTEPLIYPHLIESLNYANEKGMFTSITTNALNLKQKAQDLSNVGLNEINVSLDGPEDIHNYIRGHKSSFRRAIDGINELVKINANIEISIYCVITEWNIGHLVDFLEQIKHLPLKQVGFMHTNFITEDMANKHNLNFGKDYPATFSNTEEINWDKMDLNLLLEEIKTIKSNNYSFSVLFSPELTTVDDINNYYHNPDKKLASICGDIFRSIMIKSDGSIIPAHGRCYNLTIGNLYEENLKTIWNSSVISKFRKDIMKNEGLFPACTRCCSAF